MKEHEVTEGEFKLMHEHGLGVSMTVAEARDLFDKLPDDENLAALSNVLDQAQGAVYSESAGQAYVIIVINP